MTLCISSLLSAGGKNLLKTQDETILSSTCFEILDKGIKINYTQTIRIVTISELQRYLSLYKLRRLHGR